MCQTSNQDVDAEGKPEDQDKTINYATNPLLKNNWRKIVYDLQLNDLVNNRVTVLSCSDFMKIRKRGKKANFQFNY